MDKYTLVAEVSLQMDMDAPPHDTSSYKLWREGVRRLSLRLEQAGFPTVYLLACEVRRDDETVITLPDAVKHMDNSITELPGENCSCPACKLSRMVQVDRSLQ